jgi:hypothetical protein
LSLKKAKKRQFFAGLHWFARFRYFARKCPIGIRFVRNRSLTRLRGSGRLAQPEPLSRILNPHRGPCVTLPLACFDELLAVGHIVIPIIHTHGFTLLRIDHRVNFTLSDDPISVSPVVISLILKALLPFRLVILLFFQISHARRYLKSWAVSNFFLHTHICIHTRCEKLATHPWRASQLVTIKVMLNR